MGASTTPIELEERRRRRMSLALLAGVLVAGVAISNERALFTTGIFDEAAAAATIRALVATPPTPWQALGVPRLFPIHHARRAMAVPPAVPPAAYAARTPEQPIDQISPLATPDPLAPPSLPDIPGPMAFAPPPFLPIGPILPPTGGDPGPGPGPVDPVDPNPPVVSPVPEPSVWAMIILGFACVGATLRFSSRWSARARKQHA